MSIDIGFEYRYFVWFLEHQRTKQNIDIWSPKYWYLKLGYWKEISIFLCICETMLDQIWEPGEGSILFHVWHQLCKSLQKGWPHNCLKQHGSFCKAQAWHCFLNHEGICFSCRPRIAGSSNLNSQELGWCGTLWKLEQEPSFQWWCSCWAFPTFGVLAHPTTKGWTASDTGQSCNPQSCCCQPKDQQHWDEEPLVGWWQIWKAVNHASPPKEVQEQQRQDEAIGCQVLSRICL